MRLKLPHSYYNVISLVGTFLIIVALCSFVFLYVLSSIAPTENPYIGLALFIILPMPFLLGLILVPAGMLRKYRRQAGAAEQKPPFPVIDFNTARNKIAFTIFAVGGILFGTFTIYVLYEGYHYTETTTFCGELCHQVMQPEYVTYRNSPHARVGCAECHVGSGANFYVKSKLSGSYQVYATVRDIYPRPIPTPVKNLRPARETCEECHWPEKFYDSQQVTNHHYLCDEENTPWTINMLIKIGGGTQQEADPTGSHWHVHSGNKVEYIATDEKRLSIPWVRYTNTRTGEVKEFASKNTPLAPEERSKYEIRTMDCMDCHNRPTHVFRTPNEAINLAVDARLIDRALPNIKSTGIDALVKEYPSEKEALSGIEEFVTNYYKETYSEIYAAKAEQIGQAVRALQRIYQDNFFPDMKSRWDVYPDNIGHLNFPGCYRCHDGTHADGEGAVITNTCTTCHTILSLGMADSLAMSQTSEGLEFVHPVDIGEAWKETGCYECHTGANP